MSTGENVQKWTQRHHAIFFSFFRRIRATSVTQRRVENTRVHIWTFSPVSAKVRLLLKITRYLKIALPIIYFQVPLKSSKAEKFERMSITGNSHLLVTRGSRVSPAPPYHILPAFPNIHGRSKILTYGTLFFRKYYLIIFEEISKPWNMNKKQKKSIKIIFK